MEVIPEPAKNTASVLVLTMPSYVSKTPFAVISGSGETDYVCGACNVVIASRVDRGRIVNLVFKCLNCQSFNVVRGT
jgi:predicted RNA-binding Zn-ribbon protein involved in translation (DUF1610 family)